MKKELRRSFLQKNEIDDCMVELLKKYGSYIRAKAISAVSNEAEREELTAGIIVHLYEKLSKMVYTEEGKFEYWLHTVVNHYIVSWRRKKAKRLPISDIALERIPSVSSFGESLHRERLYETLWKAVDTLEDSQREILLLHFQQGICLTQIAKMKGIPYNTFYKKFKKTLVILERICIERGLTYDESLWLQSHRP